MTSRFCCPTRCSARSSAHRTRHVRDAIRRHVLRDERAAGTAANLS